MSKWDSPTMYDIIGTSAAPVTLTAAFADSRGTVFAKGFSRAHLDITYTPGTSSTNQQARILFEVSNEEGAAGATNFYPRGVDVTASTEIDLFADGGDGMGTANGIPMVLPGDKTSTAGTAVSRFWDFPDLCASYVRISARDSGSANFGTLYVRITLFP